MTTNRVTADPPAAAPEPGQDQQDPRAARRSRRRWWSLALAAVLVWLAVGGMGGQYAGRLSEVQKNDSSSFLPQDAESQRAAVLGRQFSSSQSFPAFVLLEGDQRLTTAQVDAFTAFVRAIPKISVPVAGSAPVSIGDFLLAGPQVVQVSDDKKAAFAVVAFNTSEVTATLKDGTSPIQRSIEAIRGADASLDGAGIRVFVAGPAGIIADLVKAFGGIDGILLGVAVLTVLVILLVVYRSPIVPVMVLLSAVFAEALASAAVYVLADNDVITLDGQGQGILSILVIGAATDYALLLVARYREELRRHDDRFSAMRLAWRRAFEPILASGSTVILGLLCLLLADLGPTRGLGPVGAVGIAAAMLAALTFLPALLVVFGRTSGGEHGRWVFWPGTPHVGTQGPETTGIWARVAALVGRRPRQVWIATAVVLLALVAFAPTLKARGVSQTDTFLTTVESVTGSKALAKHFPAGSGTPTVVVGPATSAQQIESVVSRTPGVASSQFVFAVRTLPGGDPEGRDVGAAQQQGAGGVQAVDPSNPTTLTGQGGPPQPKIVNGRVQLQVTLADPADSVAADATVKRLRANLDQVGADVLVGGQTASNLDVRTLSASDRNRIIPVILLVIFVVLALLLRSLVAPLILIVSNVLSFGATIGAAALVFNHVFGFKGSDPTITLYGFVFLVALGIDYSIFLMTRVREESVRQESTRSGVLTGLAVTGGVITSAGVVLAATFAALGVLPLLFLAEVAFIVAFGVLLDTLVVRSLLVPALVHDLGARVWAPSRLARTTRPAEPAP